MADPQRLLEGPGTALERTMLQELRSYQGPKTMRAHTLAALGVTGSAGLAAGGAMAWWAGKTWGARILLTTSLASVLVGIPAGYFILRHGSSPSSPPAPPAVAAMPPVQPLSAPATITVPPVLDSPGSPSPATAAKASRRGARASADLRAELDALDAVRSTLASGGTFKALSLLDAYFRNFQNGRLKLEAAILRIDALARAGQTEAARTYATEFLRRHPNSVHAARLQSIAAP